MENKDDGSINKIENTISEVIVMENKDDGSINTRNSKEEQGIQTEDDIKSLILSEQISKKENTGMRRTMMETERDFRGISTIASIQRSIDIDRLQKERLYRALSDAGRQSDGIVAVEAWVVNSKGTHLVRPDGAFWRDRHYEPSSDINRTSAFKELARLEDPMRDDYLDVSPVQPGQGFVGMLWSMSHDYSHFTGISDFGSYHGGISQGWGLMGSSSRSLRTKLFGKKGKDMSGQPRQHDMNWIEFEYLAIDPDQIQSHRVHSFLVAGIGKASGVIFDIRGYKGMVVYFAKSDCPLDDLVVGTNTSFLTCAADCIGSILAMAEPRRTALFHKLQINALTNVLDPLDAESQAPTNNPQSPVESEMLRRIHGETRLQNTWHVVKFKACMAFEKTFGKKRARPPLCMSYSESMWVFVGASISVLLTLYLAQGILFWNEPDSYAFPVGPMGALAALQFGLTAAPASQPRNVMYGTIIAGSIGLGFTEITVLPHWVRQGLGTSVAVTAMAKLGVVHPPAGALAIIYASGEYHWGHLGLSLLANISAIVVAIVVNNLNLKRQYPQYWCWNPFASY